MIFRQITHDDLGCASYLVGDDDAGVAAVVDPRLDIDEYLRLARYLGARIEHVLETHNHADHVSGHGRLAASTGRDHPHPPRGGARVRPRALRRRLGARARTARGARRAHPRPPARAHRLRAHRHRARPRAVGGAHRRLALRRRHRAARPRGRPARGRARHLPLAARPPAHAARHVRGVARAPGRLDVRRSRHRPQGLLDDRLRARPPGGARRRRRGGVRRARGRRARSAAAELPRHRGHQHGPADPRLGAGRSAHAAPGRAAPARRRARRRRPHRAAVRRRAHPRRDLHHRAARGLRLAAGVAGRPRPAR